jgi:hypothetical protein
VLGGHPVLCGESSLDCNGLVDTNNLPYMVNLFVLTYGIERYWGHQTPLESSMYRKFSLVSHYSDINHWPTSAYTSKL